MADCRRVLMQILHEIREHAPADAPLPPVPAGTKSLALVGAIALNYVAEAAKKHYGQETPALAVQRWKTPRVRRFDKSESRNLRYAYMEQGLDRLMAMTQTGNVRPRSSVKYQVDEVDSSVLTLHSTPELTPTCRRAAPNSELHDSDGDLLQVAYDLLTLSCANLKIERFDTDGNEVEMTAVTNIDEEWKATAFLCVELTLTGLARWLSAWLRRKGVSPTFELFNQVVPGTDCHLRLPPHCPPRETACATRLTIPQEGYLRLQKDRWADIRGRVAHLIMTPMPSLNRASDGTTPATYIPHLQQIIPILYNVVSGPKIINGGVAIREWQLNILKIARFTLIHLDKILVHFFNLQDDPAPVEIPTYNVSPIQDMPERPCHGLAYSARRDWAIDQCLHDMYSLKATDRKRLGIMPAILSHCMGHDSPAEKLHKYRPKDLVGYLREENPDLAWRREKLLLCRMALVGVAQTLSVYFGETALGGADVKLWDMVVPQGRGLEVMPNVTMA
jgi:hypothetical protein